MSLETATYISQLNPANPLGSDPLSDADGHLRLLKSTLQATFPNISGPVSATQAQLNSPFPVGGIIMWSGSTIPAGWLLCNGANGTPDLRDRFIVGSGGSYAIGNTGGANSVALTTAQMPSHNHGGISGGENQNHTHAGTTTVEGRHAHSYAATLRTSGFDVEDGNSFLLYEQLTATGEAGEHQHTFVTGGQSMGHQHSISAEGGNQAHENRPPYYALAFIMKAAY